MRQFIAQRESGPDMTLQQFQTTIFDYLEEKSILYVQDSHANPSQLQGKEVDFQTLEELCSSMLQGQLNKSNHAIYSLRTLKGYYLTTKGARSELSSIRWMNWGMTANGECLTVNISDCPTAEKGYSLSDILEEQVHEKYYLSENAKLRLENINKRAKERNLGYKSVEVDIYVDEFGKYYEETPQVFLNLDANFFKGPDGKRTMINIIPNDPIKDSEISGLRMPTPRECWRLQGFPDWAFSMADEVNSDSQLYKQAGNTVTVNVIRSIAKRF